MSTPNILRDTTPTVGVADPTVASCTITDAWGLFYAQGGVVMTAALRSMEAVLGRPDLQLSAASATFCRPVPCGPVEVRVDVLRDGRRGSQVHASVHDPEGLAHVPNVVVTAVFVDPQMEGPERSPMIRPVELVSPPQASTTRSDEFRGREFPLGFLDNTEWCVAAGEPAPRVLGAPPRMALWFRFTDPPGEAGEPWDPALLPIPGDSLGSALAAALTGGEAAVGSVSLQIGMQVHGSLTGSWVGIDSTCTALGGGLATGIAHLWSEDGRHVATLTQTAMLRSLA